MTPFPSTAQGLWNGTCVHTNGRRVGLQWPQKEMLYVASGGLFRSMEPASVVGEIVSPPQGGSQILTPIAVNVPLFGSRISADIMELK